MVNKQKRIQRRLANITEAPEMTPASSTPAKPNTAAPEMTPASSSSTKPNTAAPEMTPASSSTTKPNTEAPEMTPASLTSWADDEDFSSVTEAPEMTPASSSSTKPNTEAPEMTPASKPTMIDSHCHLDMVMGKESKDYYTLNPLKKAEKLVDPKIVDNYKLGIVIQCYKDPRNYTNDNYKKILKVLESEDRLFFTAGIHPNLVHLFDEKNHESNFLKLLQHPKCVGVGEFGYDFADRNGAMFVSRYDTQTFYVEKQLLIAKKINKPIIVHLRECSVEVIKDFIQLISKYLPRSHNINLHCCGKLSYEQTNMFSKVFKNLYCGFNPNTVTHPHINSIVPPNRFLLETDCPYFKPQEQECSKFTHSFPQFVYFAAKQISELTKNSIAAVIEQSNENAKAFFGSAITSTAAGNASCSATHAKPLTIKRVSGITYSDATQQSKMLRDCKLRPSDVAYPSLMEPKLRAVVPQPGTVTSQGNYRNVNLHSKTDERLHPEGAISKQRKQIAGNDSGDQKSQIKSIQRDAGNDSGDQKSQIKSIQRDAGNVSGEATIVNPNSFSVFCLDVPTWAGKREEVLLEHFEQFGCVLSVTSFLSSKTAIITFQNKTEAITAATSGHFLIDLPNPTKESMIGEMCLLDDTISLSINFSKVKL
jgi:TatD DNase family protein